MSTNDVLCKCIEQTHEQLADRLGSARAMAAGRDRPRQGHERIDGFLAVASKHLHAVDGVLLPPVRKRVPDGGVLVHDYLRAARNLEVLLAHVKAHEYGSVYETSFAWPTVWTGVDVAMAEHRQREQVLGERLTEAFDDDALVRLTERLRSAELTAPSRPHPYTFHTGMLGLMARKVMHTADLFWDTVEGRMVPEPTPVPKKPPGRVAQYFLADPRFDEEEPRTHL